MNINDLVRAPRLKPISMVYRNSKKKFGAFIRSVTIMHFNAAKPLDYI